VETTNQCVKSHLICRTCHCAIHMHVSCLSLSPREYGHTRSGVIPQSGWPCLCLLRCTKECSRNCYIRNDDPQTLLGSSRLRLHKRDSSCRICRRREDMGCMDCRPGTLRTSIQAGSTRHSRHNSSISREFVGCRPGEPHPTSRFGDGRVAL
jgi:hypothetical protein